MGIFGDLFNGIENAKGSEVGNYLPYAESKYTIKILKVKAFKTRQKGNAFTVRFEVLASDNPEVKVGVEKDYFTSDNKERDIFLNNIVDFMKVAMSSYYFQRQGQTVEPKEIQITAPMVDEAADENGAQPLAGLTMEVRTIPKKTKAGNPFTNHRWRAQHFAGAAGTGEGKAA